MQRIRFDRHELAGSFGDLGTDLPLIVGLIVACGLDATSVLVMFGAMQIATGLRYRLPMPVQPLKAAAAIAIAQKVEPGVLYGAGLAIGAVMLVLALSGLIDRLARIVPHAVIRGIQLGLGLQLAGLALRDFLPRDGATGWILGAVAFVIAILLFGNRRLPAALPLVALGTVWAVGRSSGGELVQGVGFGLPGLHVPTGPEILSGALLLALPQIPLSLGNSILATRQVVRDFFPDREVTVRKLSLTYSFMNLVNPWFGGIPTCHGSGGVAGHYAFGARSGGSVLIYGGLFLIGGLWFGGAFAKLALAFPLSVLGVMLLFESLALAGLVRDVAPERGDFALTLLVGLVAAMVPYGYVVGLVAGTLLAHVAARGRVRLGA